MRKIFPYLKPYRFLIITVFVLVGARAILDLLLPKMMSLLMQEGLGIVKGAVGITFNESRVWFWALMMLLVIITSIVVTIISGYLESKISAGFAVKLRDATYKKIQSFSLQEVDHFTTSSLITRTTNDITQLQGSLNMLLRMVILQPVLAIGAITLSIMESPSVSVILIASVGTLLGVIAIIFTATLPRFKIIQKLVDRLNLVTRENLSGLRVVRAYNSEEVQAKRMDDASHAALKQNIFVNRVMGAMWPIMGLIMGLTSLGIILYSTTFIDFINTDLSQIDPTQMMALMQYGMRTVMSFMFLSMMFIMIPRASISAKRIMEVLDMEAQVQSPKTPLLIEEHRALDIKFNQVSFKYPNAKTSVLNDISFEVKAGQTAAFIGSTGSGKSTLINLIPRFYNLTGGSITIGGVDITKLNLEDLHHLIGYVPQKGMLFGGTIKDNINFAKNATDDEIEYYASIAQANDFIKTFDDQYEHHVAQGGTNVSGGQRQRLSIARALAKKAKILIFDDSFSALDYKTDQILRKQLEQVEATKLIVAQRINTIRHADLIIVLDQGSIVGIGTHQDLLKTCDVYMEIASSQLSKEELN